MFGSTTATSTSTMANSPFAGFSLQNKPTTGTTTTNTIATPTSMPTLGSSGLGSTTTLASLPFGGATMTPSKPPTSSLWGGTSVTANTGTGMGSLTALATSTTTASQPTSLNQSTAVTATTLSRNTRFADLPDQAKNTLEEIDKFIQTQIRTYDQINVQKKALEENSCDEINVAADTVATVRVSLQNDYTIIMEIRTEVNRDYEFMIKLAQLVNAMRDGHQRVYNSTFLTKFFEQKCAAFEDRTHQYARVIDEIQQHLSEVAHAQTLTPQVLSEAMRFQIDTLVSLAGKVAEIHEQVKEMKMILLSNPKYSQPGARNPFEEARVSEDKNRVKPLLPTEPQIPSRFAQIALDTVQPSQTSNLGTSIHGQSSFGASTGSGLFGNKATVGGGLLGNTSGTGSFALGTGSGLFGSKPAFGSTTAGSMNTGLYGASQPSMNTGLFGSTTTQPFMTSMSTQPAAGGLFGAATTMTQPASGGLFGSAPKKPATGGLFGTPTAATQPISSGMFGSTSNRQSMGGMFGATTPGTQAASGLFGSQNATGNPFGTTSTQPASGALFGNTTANNSQVPSSSLFSTPASSQPQGGGLFGNTPSQPGTSLGGQAGNVFSTPNKRTHQRSRSFSG